MYDPEIAIRVTENGRKIIKHILRKQKINKILNDGKCKNILNRSN